MYLPSVNMSVLSAIKRYVCVPVCCQRPEFPCPVTTKTRTNTCFQHFGATCTQKPPALKLAAWAALFGTTCTQKHSAGSTCAPPALKSTAQPALFETTCTRKHSSVSTFESPALKSTARAALLSQLRSAFRPFHTRRRCTDSSFTLLHFTGAVRPLCELSIYIYIYIYIFLL